MGRKKVPLENRQRTPIVAMVTASQAAAWRALLGPDETPSALLRDFIVRDTRRRAKKTAVGQPQPAPVEPAAERPQSPLSDPPRGAVRAMVGLMVTFPVAPGPEVTEKMKKLKLRYNKPLNRWEGRVEVGQIPEVEAAAAINPAVPGEVTLEGVRSDG